MSWHVRFFSPSLQQEVMSPELPTRDDALREAWTLAERGENITGIEGPDGEQVSGEEIAEWAEANVERPAPSAPAT